MLFKLHLQYSCMLAWKKKRKPFSLSLCHIGEKFFVLFPFCFLCMDNCFKLYLIFSSLVIGTAMNLFLTNYEMVLSLKKQTNQQTNNKNQHLTHKPPNPHPNQPTKQMLLLLSFCSCVTRTCMLCILKEWPLMFLQYWFCMFSPGKRKFWKY